MKHTLTRIPDVHTGKVDVTYRKVINTPLSKEVDAVPPFERHYWTKNNPHNAKKSEIIPNIFLILREEKTKEQKDKL